MKHSRGLLLFLNYTSASLDAVAWIMYELPAEIIYPNYLQKLEKLVKVA